MLTQERLEEVVKEVLSELYFLQVNTKFELCKATSYLGMCYEDKITVSQYIENKQTLKNVIAHELIHAIGINNHGKDFKEVMNKINSLGLGYDVQTTSKKEPIEHIRKLRKEKRANRKSYIVYCQYCGWARVYKKKMEGYTCPHCRKVLKHKIYKDGVTIKLKRKI